MSRNDKCRDSRSHRSKLGRENLDAHLHNHRKLGVKFQDRRTKRLRTRGEQRRHAIDLF